MPRQARLRVEKGEAFYHLYCRTAGAEKDFPLNRKGAQEYFVKLLEHFSSAYFCTACAYCVMGNHYHIVVRFDGLRKRSKKDLFERASVLYPNCVDQIKNWDREKWKHFSERLHDVSELMRNIHMAYARWHNASFDCRGRFWAERFKSTILATAEAVEDCMLYVELNPLRAGLVKRPENWRYGSFRLRDMGEDAWLLPLKEVTGEEDEEENRRKHRAKIYYRGAVKTKEGAMEISEDVLKAEEARGFKTRGIYRKRFRHFTEGLAIGTQTQILNLLVKLRESGFYRRRKNAVEQPDAVAFSLR